MHTWVVATTFIALGFLGIGAVVGYLLSIRSYNKKLKIISAPVGTIRVDSSDDKPYLFLEIESVDDISSKDTVVLRVDTTNYADL